MDGYSTPDDIASKIEKLGLEGAFITDHGTVAGFTAFRKAMAKKDLFAGYGIEAYQAAVSRTDRTAKKMGDDMFHLILLAKNYEGFKNILRMSDESNRTGFHYRARIDWDLLERYHEGVIATSACMGSLFQQEMRATGNTKYLDRILNIFKDDFYIELHTYLDKQQYELNHQLSAYALERGVPVVYANDAHYAHKAQHMIHEAFLAAQYRDKLDEDNPRHPPCLYIMSEEEVRESLAYLPESVVDAAIANSDEIMQQSRFSFPDKELHLPKFKTDDGTSAKQKLISLVEDGIARLYGEYSEETREAWDRAEYELRAIIGAGLHDYFLIVDDYVRDALAHEGFVGPGRGSVGGSIIAYALGITTIDPLRYGLPFERFWNPGRTDGLPDIDIDFDPDTRLREIEYVRRRYGQDRVLPIGNHTFLWPKAAIDKAAMVLYENPPYADVKKIKAIIENTDDAGQLKTWDEIFDENTDDPVCKAAQQELEPYLNNPDLEDMFWMAQQFCGRLASYSQHASAVVISDVDLAEYLPARSAKGADDSERVLVTQDEMHAVEDAGFPKFDFLGLRNLATLMRTAELAGEFESKSDIVDFFRYQDYDQMPEQAWELLEGGFTLGVFQIEEGVKARDLVRRVRPRSIEDLAIISALNRPGPLRSGDTERYVARRAGEKDVVYPHETLEEIMAPTLGIFAFQEQVINFFVAIGYTLSEADHMRKVIGKKLPEQMAKEKPRYLECAEQFMPLATAEAIWKLIENYSKYGFNKAHAIGYAMITAWTLYAKWRWPVEFYMASIETNPKRVGSYVNEANRRGINVIGPDLNRSGVTVSRDGDTILYGFADIKGIGLADAQRIVDARDTAPYADIFDYMERCEANMGAFKKLNKAGAFDKAFGVRVLECATCEGAGRVPVMVPKLRSEGLKRVLIDCTDCRLGWRVVEPPPKTVLAEEEIEYLGIALTDIYEDIILEFREELDKLDEYGDIFDLERTEVVVPGQVLEVSKTKVRATAKRNAGREMGHIVIGWQGGAQQKSVVFCDSWDAHKWMLKKGTVGHFVLQPNSEGPRLVAAEAWKLGGEE